MVGNIHSIGMALTEAMRPEIANHFIRIETATATTVEPISASSAPIGQEFLSETGLDWAHQNRAFFFKKADIASLNSDPQLDWVVIDQADGSRWRVIPDRDEYAWQPHGQLKTSYRVIAKRDPDA